MKIPTNTDRLTIGECNLSDKGREAIDQWNCTVRTALELFIMINGREFTNTTFLAWLNENSTTLAIEFEKHPTKGATGGSGRPNSMKNLMSPKARSIMQTIAQNLSEGGSSASDPLVATLDSGDMKSNNTKIRRLLPSKENYLTHQNTRLLRDLELGEMLTSIERGITTQVDVTKVGRGAFNTKGSSWLNAVVRKFITSASLNSAIDPFAGQGDMLRLCEAEFHMSTSGLDIQDQLGWPINDSLVSIPKSTDSICITNPPYLANYSAKRKSMWPMVGSYYENTGRGDLYEIALDKCLEAFDYVVAIIPETFLHSNYPKDRCAIVSILEKNPFEDTTFPVCVTCWVPQTKQNPVIYVGEREVMTYSAMVGIKGDVSRSKRIVFNDPEGNIGLKAVDSSKADDRISFMQGKDFDYPRSSIKVSSRLMTYLNIPELTTEKDIRSFCERANTILESYRERSEDIILSGFKGNNKKGKRRRRLDYRLARKIILEALGESVQTTLPLE